MLVAHDERVYEARAVARLVHESLIEKRISSLTTDDLETALRALKAIDRMLTPVQGIYDPEHLITQAENERNNAL